MDNGNTDLYSNGSLAIFEWCGQNLPIPALGLHTRKAYQEKDRLELQSLFPQYEELWRYCIRLLKNSG